MGKLTRTVFAMGWSLLLATLLMAGWRDVAASTVGGVSVSPLGTRVPFNRPATFTVTWSVTTTLGSGTRVFSNSALLAAYDASGVPLCTDYSVFTHATTPFGNVGGLISGLATGSPAKASIRETIRIPASWLIWARDNGYRRLDYIRYFDDGSGNTGCAVVKIFVTSGGGFGGVEFGLSYIRMRFDDGSVARIIEQGGALSVRAEVRYRGHGLLRAVWEVADPASTRSGTPVYVPLRTVHQYLTGAGRTILEGPALPTGITGLHLVRLRLIEPAIDAPNLFLRYFVRAVAEPPVRLAGIALRAPDPGAPLRPETRFAWSPVEDAAAYRIELYEAPGGFGGPADRPAPGSAPAAGMLLPGDETGAALSALARKGLQGPAVYLWRVVAFDAAGRMVAASHYRRLVVPADGGAGARAQPDAGGG